MAAPVVRQLEFDFEWRITLLTLLLLPLLISLGFWQLQREEEKQELAAAFNARQSVPPVPLEQVSVNEAGDVAFLPVSLQGHYRQEQVFLLDNQVRNGRYGNEALELFELDSGQLALVNRGWLPADPARLQPTRVPAPPRQTGGLRLTGRVYVPPGTPYLLADEALPDGWPKRLQAVEMDKIAAIFGPGLFPHVVRIDAGQPGALQADWQVINISPAKHRAYAVQWFSMAAALFLVYLLRSTNAWQLIRGKRPPTSGEKEQ